MALAILYQLRDRLLNSEFNDCILLFSDLPTVDIEKCVKDSIQIFCSTPKSLTFRKFGSPPDPSPNQDGSFTLSSITLDEQKAEKVARISGEETLILLGLAKTTVKTMARKTIKSRLLVVDIRSVSDYKLGALPESVNIPFDPNDEGSFAKLVEDKIPKDKIGKKVICVAGNKLQTKAVVNFAQRLVVELNYSRVCVLHNGIDIFKTLPGILFVPNA